MFKSDDTGKLVVRVTLGLLILLHGIDKLAGGNGFVLRQVAAHGLPAFVAYGVYIGEVVAPLLLIIGLFTRAAAAIVAFNMLCAFYLTRGGTLMTLNSAGGWVAELEGMFLAVSVALIFFGAGRFSLGGSAGRFN